MAGIAQCSGSSKRRPGKEVEFESIYGPDGEWAQLFRRSPNDVRTDLLRELPSGRYVTLDLWTSQAAHVQFKLEPAADYREIDDKLLRTENQESTTGLPP